MKMRTMAPYWKRWRLWRSARMSRSRRGRRRRPLRTRPCRRTQADQIKWCLLCAGRHAIGEWQGAHGAGALAGEEPVEGHSGDDVEHHPFVHIVARDAPRVGDHLAVLHVRRA